MRPTRIKRRPNRTTIPKRSRPLRQRPSHESASSKRDKVRLALLVLKDDLPETSGQMGLFGQTSIDLREAITRLEKASKDKSISGVVLNIQNPVDRPRQDRGAARGDRPLSQGRQEGLRPVGIGHAGRLPRRLRLR